MCSLRRRQIDPLLVHLHSITDESDSDVNDAITAELVRVQLVTEMIVY